MPCILAHLPAGYSPSLTPAVLDAPSTTRSSSSSSSVPQPDTHCVVRVAGPEPGYDATSRIVTCCALTLLHEGERMLDAKNGVGPGILTPGAAFRGTRLIHRLTEQGLRFEVLQAPAAASK